MILLNGYAEKSVILAVIIVEMNNMRRLQLRLGSLQNAGSKSSVEVSAQILTHTPVQITVLAEFHPDFENGATIRPMINQTRQYEAKVTGSERSV
jgi:hypothetical protein